MLSAGCAGSERTLTIGFLSRSVFSLRRWQRWAYGQVGRRYGVADYFNVKNCHF